VSAAFVSRLNYLAAQVEDLRAHNEILSSRILALEHFAIIPELPGPDVGVSMSADIPQAKRGPGRPRKAA
jgi:hypothetical protein